MQKDMTTGNPRKLLLPFILPLLFSVVFQQMYTIFDSVIAGRAIGPEALAAVGASYPITAIFMAFAIGSSSGTSVIVSRLFGAKRMGAMKTAIQTALIASVGVSVLLMIFGRIGCETMLRWLKTPENIMADSAAYLNIYIYGLFFLFLYNVETGIFQAFGDSRTPLFLLILSSVGNIVLDIVFVAKFRMGVAGVGWATFIAQGTSAVIAFVLLLNYLKKMEISEQAKLFDTDMLKKICTIALPSICQQSFVSVGNLFVQAVINQYGSSVIAGYNAGLRSGMFFVMCALSFANGLGSFAAQNIGARKIERVYEGFRETTKLIYIFIAPCFLLCFFGAEFLVGLFVGTSDPKAMEAGVSFLRVISPCYFVVVLKFVTDAVLKSAGAMKYFMITTFTDLILRVIFSYLLAAFIGSAGVWIAWLVGWTAGTIIACYFYKKGVWLRDLYK